MGSVMFATVRAPFLKNRVVIGRSSVLMSTTQNQAISAVEVADMDIQMGREKGQWWGVQREGKRGATLICPGCAIHAGLMDHAISADGSVTPSVVCPEDCGFHEYIRLVGWE